MSCAYETEVNLLKFSTFACFCFAALGIGFGIWAGSLVIVFDGAYSLISLFLSLIALLATSYIRGSVGKSSSSVSKTKASVIESLVVLLKGVTVSFVCAVSFISALIAMFEGGREVNAGFALVFGFINVLGCYATYYLLKKQQGKHPTKIIQAECNQWLMDTVISAAVLFGFLLALVLINTGFAAYAVYADPIMVLLASVYFASVPLKMIGQSSIELNQIYQANQTASKSTGENTSLI